MKSLYFLLAIVSIPLVGFGQNDISTLHGTMITSTSHNAQNIATGMKAKFWAKDDLMRLEVSQGQKTSVSIQRGNTIYTFLQGELGPGHKVQFKDGLASMGLIRQIDVVRSRGRQNKLVDFRG